jgi:hypothetical protein
MGLSISRPRLPDQGKPIVTLRLAVLLLTAAVLIALWHQAGLVYEETQEVTDGVAWFEFTLDPEREFYEVQVQVRYSYVGAYETDIFTGELVSPSGEIYTSELWTDRSASRGSDLANIVFPDVEQERGIYTVTVRKDESPGEITEATLKIFG